MAGYAAFGMVERGRVSALPSAWRPQAGPAGDGRAEAHAAVIEDAGDAAGSTPRARLRDRVATAREQWSITTFYLFDPNSWR